MWAMRLWDEGYKRISQEMLGERLGDGSVVVRGGSVGFAESGKLGVNLEGLSRSFTNLFAPLPPSASKAEIQEGESQTSSGEGPSNSSPGRNPEQRKAMPDSPRGAPTASTSASPVQKIDVPGWDTSPGMTLSRSLTSPDRHGEVTGQEDSLSLHLFRKSWSDIALRNPRGPSVALMSSSEPATVDIKVSCEVNVSDVMEGTAARAEKEKMRPRLESLEGSFGFGSSSHPSEPLLPMPGPGPTVTEGFPLKLNASNWKATRNEQAKGFRAPLPNQRYDSDFLSVYDCEAPNVTVNAVPECDCGDACPEDAEPTMSPAQCQQQVQNHAYWGAPLAPVPKGQLPFIHKASPSPEKVATQCIRIPASLTEIDISTEVVCGQLIGEGGFGKVYIASYKGQQVALKIQGDDCLKASVLEEFRREVETMHSLPSHRNVLSLIGACTQPPRLAIVTEFCPLGSLYGLLHSPNCHLSWAQIIYMCLGAANGMAHLHRHHIVHRDLKSANLLVDHDYNVKVADFGLSRVQSDLVTMTGGLGTYQWMAPEVLGNQRYSDKADVYSFGIVIWECTAREIPYSGMQGMQAALAVMNRGLRPELPPHTPSPLADLIRSCWRPIPSQRPTMAQVAAALTSMYKSIRASSQ